MVTLADKGSLNVSGGLTLGNSGGVGTFIRSGGTACAINGGLFIGGTAILVLDDTNGPVGTSITGSLTQSNGNGTLVVVPQNGHLSTSESVGFGQALTQTNGILGPWP